MILLLGWCIPEGFVSTNLRTRCCFSGPEEVELSLTLGHKNSPPSMLPVKMRGFDWDGALSLNQCPGASCMQVTLNDTPCMQLQARP